MEVRWGPCVLYDGVPGVNLILCCPPQLPPGLDCAATGVWNRRRHATLLEFMLKSGSSRTLQPSLQKEGRHEGKKPGWRPAAPAISRRELKQQS